MPSQVLASIGQIASAIEELQLQLIDATVTIRHEERQDIAVSANNPSNWKIENGLICQVKAQSGGGGNFVSAGSFGGNVIVRGNNYGTISVGHGAIAVGPGAIAVGRGGAVINSGGRSVEIIGDEVWVDGKKVTDDSSDHSSDLTSDCAAALNTGTAKQEPDRIEIVVPLDCRSGLTIHNPGNGQVAVDTWCGGSFNLRLSGNGQWVGGRLRFRGEARADAGSEAMLNNLLNIIGRRQGALSVLAIG